MLRALSKKVSGKLVTHGFNNERRSDLSHGNEGKPKSKEKYLENIPESEALKEVKIAYLIKRVGAHHKIKDNPFPSCKGKNLVTNISTKRIRAPEGKETIKNIADMEKAIRKKFRILM